MNRLAVLTPILVLLAVGILASFGLPAYLSAKRASRERHASGCLKRMGSVEVTFKTSDSSSAAINDYWTADVAGLYYYRPAPSSPRIQMIDLAVALADGNTVPSEWSGPAEHRSKSLDGYWFQAQKGYGEWVYGARNVDRFSFVAYPDEHGIHGRLIFIFNESGTLFHVDPGRNAWIRPPYEDLPSTDAELRREFKYFPERQRGPWDKD